MDAIEVEDPTVKEIVHDIFTIVMQNQAYYADKFIETASYLDGESFYQRVAEFIDLKPHEQFILDIGCGDCRAIREIKKIKPNITTIGVDINPLLLMSGENALKNLGYNVNIHTGVNVAMDPNTQKLTLMSDLLYNKKGTFKFKRAAINLIQEDIRYAEVTKTCIVKNLKPVDIIIYTLSGGFSPHTELESDQNPSSVIKAGIEMNNVVMNVGTHMLKPGGRIIWAQRVASKNIDTLISMSFDDLGIGMFMPYYNINRIEIVNIDENKAGLGLTLPAFAPNTGRNIHYNEDVRKMSGYNFQGVIMLIDMIRK
jgi:SAM-dependent methyltransferase